MNELLEQWDYNGTALSVSECVGFGKNMQDLCATNTAYKPVLLESVSV